jgi:SAM-dependent methyltransferase
VLEIGGRSFDGKPNINPRFLPEASWKIADMFPGDGVDYVCDASDLSSISEKFDGVIATFLLEHVEFPQRVVDQMRSCLKPGGLVYLSTNFAFPCHWYPSDFYRFSDQALCSILRTAGFTVAHVGLYDRVRITPLESRGSALQEPVDCWCCVDGIGCNGDYQMDIGLDLDGTLYEHPVFFAEFIEAMTARGHKFHCISSHARSEWPEDMARLKSLGINADLISPDMMYPTRHGQLALKGRQADQLDLVFDDDGRVQAHTTTPVFCPPVKGSYSFQKFV